MILNHACNIALIEREHECMNVNGRYQLYIIGDRAPAYSVTRWIQSAEGREGGKAGGIPGLEKGGVVGRGGGNIITTVSYDRPVGRGADHNGKRRIGRGEK